MKHKVRPSDEINKSLETILFSEDSSLISKLITTAAQKIIQEALEEEVCDFLGRRWYQHSDKEDFRGYRNGYQKRKYKTSEGVLDLLKPRVRDNEYPYVSGIMNKLDSIEDKLHQIAIESYVRGLSTRDIESTFTDENGKALISKSAVSSMTDTLYNQYEEFATRDLSNLDVVYLFIDGVYEAVRKYTNNQAILCAWAICSDGSKQLLHLMACSGESTESCNAFFQDMIERGLRQPLLIISDGNRGMIKSITMNFPKAKRQRCIAHKLRNIISKVPKSAQEEIKQRVKAIYYCQDSQSAEVLAGNFIEDYAEKYPGMIKCFIEDLDACLTHLQFPAGHRRSIRTTNLIERAFVEEKRRTKIIPEHAHEKGAIGLVFAVLIRASEKWYRVNMTELDLKMLKKIRQIICPEDKENEYISYRLSA